jgi:hypothetical protein
MEELFLNIKNSLLNFFEPKSMFYNIMIALCPILLVYSVFSTNQVDSQVCSTCGAMALLLAIREREDIEKRELKALSKKNKSEVLN